MSQLMYKKDQEIKCPQCKDLIATFAIDVYMGMLVTEDDFNWKNQKFSLGEALTCKKCGYYFWQDLMDGGI